MVWKSLHVWNVCDYDCLAFISKDAGFRGEWTGDCKHGNYGIYMDKLYCISWEIFQENKSRGLTNGVSYYKLLKVVRRNARKRHLENVIFSVTVDL